MGKDFCETLNEQLKEPEVQTTRAGTDYQPELLFKSSLTAEEIEDNFKDVDVFSGIMEGLEEAYAHSKGDASEMIVHKNIDPNTPLTPAQIEMLADLAANPISADEDCPELSPEQLAQFKRISAINHEESTPEFSEKWCADTALAMAVQQIAKDEGITTEEALDAFKQTRVYNALYDFDTGVWSEGPASLIYLYQSSKKEESDDQKGGAPQ